MGSRDTASDSEGSVSQAEPMGSVAASEFKGFVSPAEPMGSVAASESKGFASGRRKR